MSQMNFGQAGFAAPQPYGDFGAYGVVFPPWAAQKKRMAQCPDMAAFFKKHQAEKAKWSKTRLVGDRQERLAIRARALSYRTKGKSAWKECKTGAVSTEDGGGSAFIDAAAEGAAAALMPMGTEMDPSVVDVAAVDSGAGGAGRTFLFVGLAGIAAMGTLFVVVKARKKKKKS